MKTAFRCFLVVFFSLFLLSCETDIILVLDEYNSPYNIVVIPKSNALSVRFLSGVTASDFAGFNFYVNTSGSFILFDDAIINNAGGKPTIIEENHSREFFNFDIPGTYVNGTKYYVSITAYGTNDLAPDKRIETPISTIVEVAPRPEGTLTGVTGVTIGTTAVTTGGTDLVFNFTATPPTVTSAGVVGDFEIQDFGYQTNFNAVIVVTNNSYPSSFETTAPLSVNRLYILYDGSTYAKIWVTSISGSTADITWGVQNNNTWNGV